MKKVHMIGNTHFDPVWLWKWDEAMSSITATFRSALMRMKEYPEFKYSFATPPVFEWIKNTSPELFEEIKEKVYESLAYRLMAHSAEDLCEMCMPKEDMERCGHDDVRHGFVITFPETKPEFDIQELEKKVNDMIAQNLPITYEDSNHISVNGKSHYCTGPRIHVSHTGKIENLHLLPHFIYDQFNRNYLLVGCVGKGAEDNLKKLDAHQQKQSDIIM